MPRSSGDMPALARALQQALRCLGVGAMREWLFWRWAVAGGGSADDVAAWCLEQWHCWRASPAANSLQESMRPGFLRKAEYLAAEAPPPPGIMEALENVRVRVGHRLPAAPPAPDQECVEQLTLFVINAMDALLQVPVIGRLDAARLVLAMGDIGEQQLQHGVEGMHAAWVAADPLAMLWAVARLL